MVIENGIKYEKFSIEYDTPDGKFSCHIYAISLEHASYMLESIKENGRVSGPLYEAKPN